MSSARDGSRAPRRIALHSPPGHLLEGSDPDPALHPRAADVEEDADGIRGPAGDDRVAAPTPATPSTAKSHYDALSYQAVALASYVGQGLLESPLHPLEETVSIIATLEEARRQVLSGDPRGPEAPA